MIAAVCQLEREWPYLEQGALARALPRWRARQRDLRRFDSPRQLLRFLNSSPPAETDGPLWALLLLARDDRLAGRFVLQAVLPALRDQAARIAAAPDERDDVWELLFLFAWETIRCYPLERRSRVAANLVLQVLHDTTRQLRPPTFESAAARARDRRILGELLGSADAEFSLMRLRGGPPVTGAEQPATEALLAGAVAAGVLVERDAQLILQTRVDGISLRLIARTSGVGYHALRQRRQRAERRLRELFGAGRDVSKEVVSDLITSAEFIPAARRAA